MGEYRKSSVYVSEIKDILKKEYVEKLRNKIIVITGSRGLISSELIDTIVYGNKVYNMNCKVYAVVRNIEAAKERFTGYLDYDLFHLIQADINQVELPINGSIDYFIHAASNTHPLYYATRPIETILTNTVGTNNMLDFAVKHGCKRFLFLSSVEIYGENKGDIEAFNENYLGYINSNSLRAGYPEGKRLGEALCQAYIKEKNLDCVIARVSRCYGPGLLKEDSKALSQFLKKAINGEDIVLKSKGDQYYSYAYVADVVSALLFLLENGACGEAYNVSGKQSDITLADLAGLIARISGEKVIFVIPDETEREGYSKATKALMDCTKLQNIGWKSQYSIEEGIKRTLQMKGM